MSLSVTRLEGKSGDPKKAGGWLSWAPQQSGLTAIITDAEQISSHKNAAKRSTSAVNVVLFEIT
jgi:hypothetical protein